MLDEFVTMVGCHRKHAVRLMRQDHKLTARSVPKGQRIYDEAVREALPVVWEASDRICGKRLASDLLDRLTHHVHIIEMNGDSCRLRQSGRPASE